LAKDPGRLAIKATVRGEFSLSGKITQLT
jgi:hypothetical protein